MILKPQPGKQEMFLSSSADIAIYGGAAGGGKTYALLLENVRHIDNPNFGSVIFRRDSTQITNEGGLWDTAQDIYAQLGGVAKQSPKYIIEFPSGAKITFAHLQYEKHAKSYQGSQVPLICFDELTHFSETQFFYLLSRNRSTCGVKPYVRATCNPDSESWVRKFLDWWIDDDGYPIEQRCGELRYFFRRDGAIIWGDSREELAKEYNLEMTDIKSVTFISSSVYDNKILLDVNPEYLGNLKALSTVEQGQLLYGNWNIKPSAGLYFSRDDFRIVKSPPSQLLHGGRGWDLAATAITPENDNPDRTVGLLMARMKNGQFIFLDGCRGAYNADKVQKLVQSCGKQDRAIYGFNTIVIPQDPGQAGKQQAQFYKRLLAGFNIQTFTQSAGGRRKASTTTAPSVAGSKITRALALSAQVQAGNVYLLEGEWNEWFLNEMNGFPDLLHDDVVDAASGIFNFIAASGSWNGLAD